MNPTEGKTSPKPAYYQSACPTMMKFCKTCQKQTPHQIRGGPRAEAVICIACLNRALAYELERD